MRACCVRRSGCRREGLRAVLTAVSAYTNREKCCPDCVGVCAECVQVNPIFHVHVTPSPWTHTHVAPLHKHAHPVSQKVPLEGEGRGSRVAKGGWGRVMAWRARRNTPLSSRICPCFRRFPVLCPHLSAPAHPKRRATVPRNSEDTPPPQRQATGRRIRQLQSQSGAEEGGGRCSMLEAFASMGGRGV